MYYGITFGFGIGDRDIVISGTVKHIIAIRRNGISPNERLTKKLAEVSTSRKKRNGNPFWG